MTYSLVQGVTTPSASVTVYWADTATKPTIYSTPAGTTKSNPITADAVTGSYAFYVDDGHYKIVNGSAAGDLTDVRVSTALEGRPTAADITMLPFLGSTTRNLQAFAEAVIAGTESESAGTFTGPVTNTSTYTTTQSVVETSTDGIVLQNTTAATVTDDAWSPRLRFHGSGWKSNATAATKTGDWIVENQMQSGALAPTSDLVFAYSANGGAYTNALTISSTGTNTLAGGVASTSSTTGTWVVTGGVGISGALYTDDVISTSGTITTSNATAATSTTAGSIVTAGGVAAAKDSFFGGLIEQITANGSASIIQSASELLTLSTSGTTTDTSANLLPANSLILAVTADVTTTITTATDWKLGDPTTASRFSAANSTMTAGATAIGILQWSGAVTTLAAGPSQPSAAKVRVTTTGTPGAGAIRITVWYMQFVAPTS